MSQTFFPVTYSLMDSSILLEVIAQAYALPDLLACRLHRVSWNTTYILCTHTSRFIVRIYGAHWRSPAEIQYELDLLRHVAAHGCGVAMPLARTDQTFLTPIAAPEGMRYAVVFTYAPGMVPEPFPLGDATQSVSFGRALAAFHRAAQTFTPATTRMAHTAANLVDRSLERLQPLLHHRLTDWDDLQKIAARVRDQLATAAQHLTWGVIHGDPFSANATLSDSQQVTWFDFDLCGSGWHISDIASGYASAMGQDRTADEKAHVWQSFLSGYRSQHALSDEALTCIPLLLTANTIYLMSVNALKGPIQGYEYWGSDAFFTDWIQLVRMWADQIG